MMLLWSNVGFWRVQNIGSHYHRPRPALYDKRGEMCGHICFCSYRRIRCSFALRFLCVVVVSRVSDSLDEQTRYFAIPSLKTSGRQNRSVESNIENNKCHQRWVRQNICRTQPPAGNWSVWENYCDIIYSKRTESAVDLGRCWFCG